MKDDTDTLMGAARGARRNGNADLVQKLPQVQKPSFSADELAEFGIDVTERVPGEDPVEPEHSNEFSANAIAIAAPIREHNQQVAEQQGPGGVPRTKDGFAKEFVDPFEGNRVSYRQLRHENPKMHEPVIGHLLRAGETMNLISVSKIGKSWMMYGLLLSIATGRPWLGRFPTAKGRVLLIDNELHKPTLAFRIKTVADAMGIHEDEYADNFDIWAQRGNLQDIFGIIEKLSKEEFTERNRYVFIGLDAKYRAVPAGKTENDNAAETQFYNAVDGLALRMMSGFGMVHHSTKGSQSEKRVTDVGSGAGAQSRAADCHLVLREHEDNNTVVLEAAVRSFAPVEPIVLRWVFPLWNPDESADPTMLKGKKTVGEEKRAQGDEETRGKILKHTAGQWLSRTEIRTKTGFGPQRTNRGISLLLDDGKLEQSTEDRPRNPGTEVFKAVPNDE